MRQAMFIPPAGLARAAHAPLGVDIITAGAR